MAGARDKEDDGKTTTTIQATYMWVDRCDDGDSVVLWALSDSKRNLFGL